MVLKIVVKKGKRKLQDRESYCVFRNIFGSWDVKKSFFYNGDGEGGLEKNFLLYYYGDGTLNRWVCCSF